MIRPWIILHISLCPRPLTQERIEIPLTKVMIWWFGGKDLQCVLILAVLNAPGLVSHEIKCFIKPWSIWCKISGVIERCQQDEVFPKMGGRQVLGQPYDKQHWTASHHHWPNEKFPMLHCNHREGTWSSHQVLCDRWDTLGTRCWMCTWPAPVWGNHQWTQQRWYGS